MRQRAFTHLAGLESVHIAEDGGNPAILTMLGGHTDFAVAHPNELLRQRDDLKILAVTTEERWQSIPDVPTFKEQGYDIPTNVWKFVMAPAGIPQERKQILYNAIYSAMQDSEFQEREVF